MGFVVNLGEPLKIKVRIDLRCCNLGMTEELLNGPQVPAGLQQMACKGVAQHMRMNRLREPKRLCSRMHNAVNGPSMKPRAHTINEDRPIVGLATQFQKNARSCRKPVLCSLNGRPANRKPAKLAALAHHNKLIGLKIQPARPGS
jgi:hypothetical protein